MAHDLFSRQASSYARFRPGYPQELFDYILKFVVAKDAAWDCATGNGQAAIQLAGYFKIIEATDLSADQIAHSTPHKNIRYSIAEAEQTFFPENSFDLITVATAYHWLNHEKFYTEAKRVGKDGCIVAAWAYNLLQSEVAGVNAVINHLYSHHTKPFWHERRKWVDEGYENIPFDFEPLPSQKFFISCCWSIQDLLGFLSTWSAVAKFKQERSFDPLELIDDDLRMAWPRATEKLQFKFPLFLKLGRISK